MSPPPRWRMMITDISEALAQFVNLPCYLSERICWGKLHACTTIPAKLNNPLLGFSLP